MQINECARDWGIGVEKHMCFDTDTLYVFLEICIEINHYIIFGDEDKTFVVSPGTL